MIAKVKIDQVVKGDSKTGETNGRKWERFPVGIKVGDKWYNASFFKKEEADEIKEGLITLYFYQEEYEGKTYSKFKIPSQFDLLEARLESLEKKFEQLELKSQIP